MNTRKKLITGAVAGLIALGGAIGTVGLLNKNKPLASAPSSGTRKVVGRVMVQKIKGGEVVEADTIDRKLVARGIRLMFGLLTGDSTTGHFGLNSWIGIGDNNTPTDTSMISLMGAETYFGKVDSISYWANRIRWFRTFADTAACGPWGEIGLFNKHPDSSPTMLDRATGDWGVKSPIDTWRAIVELSFE